MFKSLKFTIHDLEFKILTVLFTLSRELGVHTCGYGLALRMTNVEHPNW